MINSHLRFKRLLLLDKAIRIRESALVVVVTVDVAVSTSLFATKLEIFILCIMFVLNDLDESTYWLIKRGCIDFVEKDIPLKFEPL